MSLTGVFVKQTGRDKTNLTNEALQWKLEDVLTKGRCQVLVLKELVVKCNENFTLESVRSFGSYTIIKNTCQSQWISVDAKFFHDRCSRAVWQLPQYPLSIRSRDSNLYVVRPDWFCREGHLLDNSVRTNMYKQHSQYRCLVYCPILKGIHGTAFD